MDLVFQADCLNFMNNGVVTERKWEKGNSAHL